jgi:hypothetical protein
MTAGRLVDRPSLTLGSLQRDKLALVRLDALGNAVFEGELVRLGTIWSANVDLPRKQQNVSHWTLSLNFLLHQLCKPVKKKSPQGSPHLVYNPLLPPSHLHLALLDLLLSLALTAARIF